MFSFIKENFLKIKSALHSTTRLFKEGLRSLFQEPWSEESVEKLESLLYKTDMGSSLVEKALKQIKHKKSFSNLLELESELIEFGAAILNKSPPFHLELKKGPTVFLIVGTNGSGKTTFSAKLAHYFQNQKKTVLLGAADTFRAAAILQLEHWAERIHVPVIKQGPGADPAAVCYDAIASAIAKNIDVVILDSAGRLEHKLGLMNELKKIHQSCNKALLGAPHYTLLNLDASLGQSALVQAKAFHEATPLSGLVLSKFDGSPKGGMLLSIAEHLHTPIAFLGTGEKLEDLAAFDQKSYLEALFKSES